MQLVSKNRNVHTYSRGPVAGSFQSKLWPRRRASALEAALLASRAFALVFSWYNVIIALSLCLSSGALQHTVNTSIIAAKIVQKQAPLFRSGLEAPPLKKKQHYQSGQYKMQTADRVQNADWEFTLFFRLIRDNNTSSYNLPSVTQSLFRDHLLRLFALLSPRRVARSAR